MKIFEEDGYLQAKERSFRRNQLCPYLDLGLLASRTQQISVVYATQSVVFVMATLLY